MAPPADRDEGAKKGSARPADAAPEHRHQLSHDLECIANELEALDGPERDRPEIARQIYAIVQSLPEKSEDEQHALIQQAQELARRAGRAKHSRA